MSLSMVNVKTNNKLKFMYDEKKSQMMNFNAEFKQNGENRSQDKTT